MEKLEVKQFDTNDLLHPKTKEVARRTGYNEYSGNPLYSTITEILETYDSVFGKWVGCQPCPIAYRPTQEDSTRTLKIN